MRYVIGIIAGVVLIMGAVGGMENDTLNITYSLKMMVIGVILIYECYIIRQKKKVIWSRDSCYKLWFLGNQSQTDSTWHKHNTMEKWNMNGG